MIKLLGYRVFVFAGIALSMPAQAQVHFEPLSFEPRPIPFAVSVRDGSDTQSGRIALSIIEVAEADLTRAMTIEIAAPVAFETEQGHGNEKPDLRPLLAKNVQEILETSIAFDADGKEQIRLGLWDVLAGSKMLDESIPIDAVDWRHTGHLVANVIYQHSKGTPARFDEPVLFAGPAGNTGRRLVTMEQDGSNPRYLTDRHEAAFPPKLGADGTLLCLVRSGKTQRLYRFEPDGRRRALPGNFADVIGTPAPSPDGRAVLLSRAREGRANLYWLDLRTQEETQLSNGAWMDTDISYAPDDQGIAFVSNRGRLPQIYVMKADGSAPRRVSFGSGRYIAVAWSSAAGLLALVKAMPDTAPGEAAEHFVVGVMRADGSGERPLGEFPAPPDIAWTSDGRALFAAGGMPTENDRTAALTVFNFVDARHFYMHRKDWRVDLPGDATPSPAAPAAAPAPVPR